MSIKMIKFLAVFCLLFGVLVAQRNDGFVFEDDRVSQGVGASCKIKTGEPGICRLLSSCEVYYEGLKNKTIAYSFLVRCSFVDLDEVICCPLDVKPTNVQLLTGETFGGTPIDNRGSPERPAVEACQRYSLITSVGFHILDGVPVSPGEYPHVGGLVYPVGGGTAVDYRCGGSLISERYVLTAAHCVSDVLSQPTFVRLGVVVFNASRDDDNFDGFIPLDVDIENITIHSLYRSKLNYHDVALIRLRQDVEFSNYVRPACLHTDISDIDSNIPLVVTGWGVTNVQTRTRSTELLQTNVTTVPLNDCNATHVDFGLPREFGNGLNPGHYCAFDPELKKDACESDSGGPLQLVNKGQSTIVGVISFGRSCATSLPAVYARVAFYLDWIESIVWPAAGKAA